jgi:hypothetical protein
LVIETDRVPSGDGADGLISGPSWKFIPATFVAVNDDDDNYFLTRVVDITPANVSSMTTMTTWG